jgi:hypothetical protein
MAGSEETVIGTRSQRQGEAILSLLVGLRRASAMNSPMEFALQAGANYLSAHGVTPQVFAITMMQMFAFGQLDAAGDFGTEFRAAYELGKERGILQ